MKYRYKEEPSPKLLELHVMIIIKLVEEPLDSQSQASSFCNIVSVTGA